MADRPDTDSPFRQPALDQLGGDVKVSRVVEISRRFARHLGARLYLPERAAREALGLRGRGTRLYRSDSWHPLYTHDELHPDNRLALAAVSGADIQEARGAGRLEEQEDLRAALSERMVLVGSPTSEGFSRPIFGYREQPGGRGLAYDAPTMDLPLRWELDAARVEKEVRRFVQGRPDEVERPNWTIVDASGTSFVPELDPDGRLATDYLLLTKMPNFVSEEGIDAGHWITSVGGTHGTGTQGVGIALRDREVVTALRELHRKGVANFQLLLQVGGIEHDSRRGTRARKVRVERRVALPPSSDPSWGSAAQRARENLEVWRDEVRAREERERSPFERPQLEP